MPMNANLSKWMIPVLLVCAAAPAMAGNVFFLKNAAMSEMNDEDVQIMLSAARNALDHTADGESRRWENAQTGATGVLTPLATFEQDGAPCRRLEISNDVKGVTGRSTFVFCNQPDGTWKVPAKSPAKPAATE